MPSTKQNLRDFLEKDQVVRLEHIRRFTEDIWAQGDIRHPFYTLHGQQHSKQVETIVDDILAPNHREHHQLEKILDPQQIFCLVASVWLHDLGMIVPPTASEVVAAGGLGLKIEDWIRDVHHRRSNEYIVSHADELRLSREEASIVGLICEGHRKVDLYHDSRFLSIYPDIRFLAAVLRVADELDITKARTPPQLMELSWGGMDGSSRWHWLKHWCVTGSQHKHERLIDQEPSLLVLTYQYIVLLPNERYLPLFRERVTKPIEEIVQQQYVGNILAERKLAIGWDRLKWNVLYGDHCLPDGTKLVECLEHLCMRPSVLSAGIESTLDKLETRNSAMAIMLRRQCKKLIGAGAQMPEVSSKVIPIMERFLSELAAAQNLEDVESVRDRFRSDSHGMRAEVGNEEVEKELLRLAEIGWRVLSFDLGDKTTKQSHFRHIVWSLGTEANDLAAWVLIHQSNDLELVEFALSALAKNTPAEYYQAVTKATENPDPSIRVQAIKVLRRLAGKDTLVKLAEILSNDPNEEVRGEATSAIGELMNYSQRANREWSGSRILLVDQNAPLADELTRRGVEVCIACTEDEIRRTLERWQPHIVVCELLDLRFEQRQIINHVDEPPGLYLARLVRELAGASVPIVATSEIDPEQIVAQLAQIRAVYKRKPTTVRDFARAIESLLSTTGALEHRKSTTAATTDGSIISQDNRSIVNIGKAWAVLIGVNNYDDPFIANLGVCVNDVHAVGEMLTQQYGNVEFLTDLTPQQSPTRANILTSLSTTAQMAGEDDLILFYFSGHGVAETGESFFLSQDTRLSALKYTAVSMRDVSELLKRSVARAKVIIVDACHSGANLGKAPALMSKEFIQRVFDQAEGMAVLASCKHEQQSWEWAEKKRSVFTYYLLEALSGLSDTDKKGFVTVSDVARYVTHGVKSWAVRNRVPQTPTLQYEVSGDIVLVRYQSPGGH